MGKIVNAVNDSYVLTNYTFAWIPAGLLILITVLASTSSATACAMHSTRR